MEIRINAKSDKQRDYAMSFVSRWIGKVDRMIEDNVQRLDGDQKDYPEEKEWLAALEAKTAALENGKKELVALIEAMDAGQIIDAGKGNEYDDVGRLVESGRKTIIENSAPEKLIRKIEKQAQETLEAAMEAAK